jgi:hypothetical protein
MATSPSRLAGLLLAGAIMFWPLPASSQDFEGAYTALVDAFGDALPDASLLEDLVGRADALADQIQEHRRANRDGLSRDELNHLRDLRREVVRFESVARTVGQTSNGARVSIEGFDVVRERLGLEPRVVQTLDSGLELVRLEVGSFVSLLWRNPTKVNLTAMYGVNDPDHPGGTGNALCESYSVLAGLFNSRDRDVEAVEFLSLESREVRAGGCD